VKIKVYNRIKILILDDEPNNISVGVNILK
jgi:hypothetical protein